MTRAPKLEASLVEIGGQTFSVCFLDPDYRPNTFGISHCCAICSKKIHRPDEAAILHLVMGGMWALSVGDEERYQALNILQPGGQFRDEMGCMEIGADCARRLPPGFTHPAKVSAT